MNFTGLGEWRNVVPRSGLRGAIAAIAAAGLLPFAAFGYAVGDDTRPGLPNAEYEIALKAIKEQDWKLASENLEVAAVTEPGNPDIQKWLGYAYRKQGKLELAFQHLDAALKMDPNNRGAQEYIGETYLLAGNKAKAQEHLAALLRICGANCEEYRDLAAAIAKAK
jgi:predicted Zn-dependent protease